MNKTKREIKSKSTYEFCSGEYGRDTIKSTTSSKLKCGKVGIDCLIKN